MEASPASLPLGPSPTITVGLSLIHISNVDAKYDAEIKAAEGNTALQEKLEKKQDVYKRQLPVCLKG